MTLPVEKSHIALKILRVHAWHGPDKDPVQAVPEMKRTLASSKGLSFTLTLHLILAQIRKTGGLFRSVSSK